MILLVLQIIDQRFFNFLTEDISTSGWLLNGNKMANLYQVTKCGPYTMLGGYNVFGVADELTTSYSNLQSHATVLISFFFMKIGNWNNQYFMVLDNNNNTMFEDSFSSQADSPAYTICGSTLYPEALRLYRRTFQHSSKILNLTFKSTLTQPASISSWGIFNLTVFIALCDASCLTCATYNDPTQCITCKAGLFLQNSTLASSSCLLTCSNGTYPENSNWTCNLCHQDCKTCRGPGLYNCLSCNPGKFLQNEYGQNLCVETCNSNSFGDTSDNTCKICDSSCMTCNKTGNQGCLSCQNQSYYLQAAVGPTGCASQCSGSTYPNDANKTCLNCWEDCLTCSNGSQFDCLSCKIGEILSSPAIPNSCQHFFNPQPNYMSFYMQVVNNPILFELVFSSSWKYMQQNINTIVVPMMSSGNDVSITSYQIFVSSLNSSRFLLSLNYSLPFPAQKYLLIVNLQINYLNSDYEYYLMNTSASVWLGEYHKVLDTEFYNSSNLNVFLSKFIIKLNSF